MRAGQVSVTAARVAALRLHFPRVPTDFGDPAADEALHTDVAGGWSMPASVTDPEPPMVRYLRARTAFFDHVVVRALAAGLDQLVTVAAGYDGRAIRYRHLGTSWFEVDHPATQADKRSRLARLGLDSSQITFVSADLADGDVDERLLEAGFDADRPAAFLVEGLAVYLELPVLRSLLVGLRTVAAAGSVLAISLSVDRLEGGDPGEARARFRESVAAVGEPARTTLTAPDSQQLLRDTRWLPDVPVDRDDLRWRAGLVIARPAPE